MFWACVYYVVGIGEPWHPRDPTQYVDVTSEMVRLWIVRAEDNEERERGGHVAWTYSRDRVVERRELRLESQAQKDGRLWRARADKLRAQNEQLERVS